MGPIGELGAADGTSLVQSLSCACYVSKLPWAGAGGNQNHLGRRIAALQNQKSSRRLRVFTAPECSQSQPEQVRETQGDERAAGGVSAQRSCWYMRRLNSESDEPWSSHTHSCPPVVVLRIAHCLNPNLL